ncbi:MAG: hypothetical protein ACR2OZ_12400 [Verrucomicrobiales bacterium]
MKAWKGNQPGDKVTQTVSIETIEPGWERVTEAALSASEAPTFLRLKVEADE